MAVKFLVQVKALYIYENLSKDEDDDNANHSFQVRVGLASSQRHNFNSIKMTREAASADTVAAEKFFIAL